MLPPATASNTLNRPSSDLQVFHVIAQPLPNSARKSWDTPGSPLPIQSVESKICFDTF